MILHRAVRFEGRGLHGGRETGVSVVPATTGRGPAARLGGRDVALEALEPIGTHRSTALRDPVSGQEVGSVEHLLAALAGLDLWDVTLVPEGGEIPVLDGSALPFARALLDASVPGPAPRAAVMSGPVRVEGHAGVIEAEPAGDLVLHVTVEFEDAHVGRQFFTWARADGRFMDELARARTFGFLEEVPALRARGLVEGGSLDCALVFGPGGAINPGGVRYADEPVRHKTLDLLGDLALVGRPVAARVRARRPSHALNHELVHAIRAAI